MKFLTRIAANVVAWIFFAAVEVACIASDLHTALQKRSTRTRLLALAVAFTAGFNAAVWFTVLVILK